MILAKDHKNKLAMKVVRRLEVGIDAAIVYDADVKNALVRGRLRQRLTFDLTNATLPNKTPVNRAELWFDPNEKTVTE